MMSSTSGPSNKKMAIANQQQSAGMNIKSEFEFAIGKADLATGNSISGTLSECSDGEEMNNAITVNYQSILEQLKHEEESELAMLKREGFDLSELDKFNSVDLINSEVLMDTDDDANQQQQQQEMMIGNSNVKVDLMLSDTNTLATINSMNGAITGSVDPLLASMPLSKSLVSKVATNQRVPSGKLLSTSSSNSFFSLQSLKHFDDLSTLENLFTDESDDDESGDERMDTHEGQITYLYRRNTATSTASSSARSTSIVNDVVVGGGGSGGHDLPITPTSTQLGEMAASLSGLSSLSSHIPTHGSISGGKVGSSLANGADVSAVSAHNGDTTADELLFGESIFTFPGRFHFCNFLKINLN